MSERHPINCDQVAWMMNAIRRYLPPQSGPSVSREHEMQAYGLLYELMEVAGLYFADDGALHNATPKDLHRLRWPSKAAEEAAWKEATTNSIRECAEDAAMARGAALAGGVWAANMQDANPNRPRGL